jgi:hydrogenase maturation factor HypF (carbamoyltransferase family)
VGHRYGWREPIGKLRNRWRREAALRPVVILDKRVENQLTRGAAPYLKTIGVRLPDSGLEVLLLTGGKKSCRPLIKPVRTPAFLLSANIEFIKGMESFNIQGMVGELPTAVDFILRFDLATQILPRETEVRIIEGFNAPGDTSPVSARKWSLPISLGSHAAPLTVKLPFSLPAVLAVGVDRQNTTCHTYASKALLGWQNGDLKKSKNLARFERDIQRLEKLGRFQPELLAHDLDKQSIATRYLLERVGYEALPSIAPIKLSSSAGY